MWQKETGLEMVDLDSFWFHAKLTCNASRCQPFHRALDGPTRLRRRRGAIDPNENHQSATIEAIGRAFVNVYYETLRDVPEQIVGLYNANAAITFDDVMAQGVHGVMDKLVVGAYV